MKVFCDDNVDSIPAAYPVVAGHGTGLEGAGGFRLGYRRWLDGLRGLAILSVLAFHLGLLPGGSLGVDVFFVLSGFLITALLVEEWQWCGTISLRAFYLRRGLRLLPAFLALLLVLFLSSFWMPSAAEAGARRSEVLVAGCYVANWPAIHQTAMPTLGHTWSLSVEEQFYLLWPMLLYGMLRLTWSRRRILLLVCTGIFASAACRMVLYFLDRTSPEKAATVLRLYMGLDTRADTLLVGCLVGLLASWDLLPRSERFVSWVRVASLASVASLIYITRHRCLDHAQFYYGLFTAVALMVGCVVVHMLLRPSRLGSLLLECPPLVYIGRLSYGIYLFHIPVISWLGPTELGWGHPTKTLTVVGLTSVAAILSYLCIERPCLRLKDLWGRRAPIAVANALPPADKVYVIESPERAAA
ncbi:MAG TPA: acyltransferase [Pirellulales bacterium]|nr:acyltransferase [Pirellulales bacterium]